MDKPDANSKSKLITPIAWGVAFLLVLSNPGMVFAGEGSQGAGSSDARFGNDTFGFSIRMPDGWAMETEEMPGEITVIATEPKDNGTVFVISVDFQGEVSTQDFILFMEEELAKELTFMKMKEGANARENPLDKPGERSHVTFREYSGKYFGFRMKTLAGYTVAGKYGYCIVGVYAESDKNIKKVISQCLGSFCLDPSGSENRDSAFGSGGTTPVS